MKAETRKILIVEDEEQMLETLAELIKLENWQVKTASNGKEALIRLTEDPDQDIILSDINMPSMNGLDLLGSIRSKNLRIPFIILSGVGDRASVLQALKLGAFDFLDKPCTIKKLMQVLNDAWHHAQCIKEIDEMLEQACAASSFTGEQLQTFRDLQRQLLVLRVSRANYEFKKVGS